MGFGFDSIDRQFQPKAKAKIELECRNCGGTDHVLVLYPLWHCDDGKIPLCRVCRCLANPTAKPPAAPPPTW